MAQMVFKRYEIKYALTDAQRDRLEAEMAAHMVPDEHGASTVRNIYYDTPDRLLARRSAEHPYYKEKLRIRSYAEAGERTPVFLELKKKCDGIVYKRRCTLPLAEADALLRGLRAPQTQIERELAFSASRYEGLAPAMFVVYDREAFYASDDHEFRMTFDRAVRCRWRDLSLAGGTGGLVLQPETESLLEVKCAAGMPLWLVSFLSEEGIFKARFSKYGTAVQRQMELEGAARIRQPELSRVRVPAAGPMRPVRQGRHLRAPAVPSLALS